MLQGSYKDYIKKMLKTCCHIGSTITIKQSIFQRGGYLRQICTSAWKNFSTDPGPEQAICGKRHWNMKIQPHHAAHLYWKPRSAYLSELLEDKRCAMLLPLCRHRQRSPHWFCGLGWSYQLPGSHLPHSRKGIFPARLESVSCLGMEALKSWNSEREETEINMESTIFPTTSGNSQNSRAEVNGIISSSEEEYEKDRSQPTSNLLCDLGQVT